MKNTYYELERFIVDMTEEISGIKATIKYLETYMMDESPMVPDDIAQLKAELTEATDALESAKAYKVSLAALN